MTTYREFLNNKIKLAEKSGFKVAYTDLHAVLMPHQKDIVKWAIEGGSRAIFASFGLGKTLIQLEIHRQIELKKDGYHLIVCPLGVKYEFMRDAKKIGIEEIRYITNSNQVSSDCKYYITNYERIRKGDIDPKVFVSLTLDEASILRGLSTETTDVIMKDFSIIPYRFVCTATPSPNRFLELINYAEFLKIMDRGQSLTRFFQRDSQTAGNLTLHENRKQEFWFWMSSWACFITKPSDLGYTDTGYDLPPIKIVRHLIRLEREVQVDDRTGQTSLIADSSESLPAAAAEKKLSIYSRVEKMKEILSESPDDKFLIWHHLNPERDEIQRVLGKECKSVWGSQNLEQREDFLVGFSEGKYRYLSTKPEIAGSGCNFQYHCHKAVFVGINYKFNDFIQSIHRIYRFMQEKEVEIHIIYTDAEEEILRKLEEKWQNHITLQSEMTAILKKHGLNSDKYKKELTRQMFSGRKEMRGKNFVAILNDCGLELPNWKSNSIGLYKSSIPFSDQYEYSTNYNCFGHNHSTKEFFEQMDFVIPEMYRTLQPGRVACIHVKDRLRFSFQNNQGFTSLEPFSDDVSSAFRRHGFYLMTRITVVTDVVRENNQSYRLGYTENCKDGTTKGAGMPEYILVFRKPPTEKNNSYADVPVFHEKEDYSLGRWQLDAHGFWKSSGTQLFNPEFLKKLEISQIQKLWYEYELNEGYDYEKHVKLNEILESLDRLPSTFLSLPPHSFHTEVWDDINRMDTLNLEQTRKGLIKHICPEQRDMVRRCIERYSNKGDTVADPFAGLFTVPLEAGDMGRIGIGIELNEIPFKDGVNYLRHSELKKNSVLELFEK